MFQVKLTLHTLVVQFVDPDEGYDDEEAYTLYSTDGDESLAEQLWNRLARDHVQLPKAVWEQRNSTTRHPWLMTGLLEPHGVKLLWFEEQLVVER